MSLTAATMFSGIGAPEIAMPSWDWRWHAEIEKFPSAVMAARHPQSINLGDVSAPDFAERAADIARPNVLVFGSPCQSFSVAGKRLGMDDPRGNLALVALGIVDRLKPDWFTFENVPGLFSSFSGSEQAESEIRDRARRVSDVGEFIDSEEDRDFAAFLARVHELGYSGAWTSLDAQWFGVAQRRQRLFFVGHSRDWRRAAAVLLEPESLCGHHPPCREAGKGVAPTIASRPTGGGGLGTDFDCDGGLITREVSHCLNAGGMGRQDYEMETLVAHALRADGFDASEDGTGRGTPIVPFNITPSNSNKDFNAREADYAQAITAGGNRPSARGGDLIAFDLRGREGGAQFEGPHPTANIRAASGGSSRSHVAASAVRRLTPRECERLQGFPDDYTLIQRGRKPAADGPRYKALGNSMAVPVVRWILSRIEAVDGGKA